ncbi:hypothetical protein NC651_005034 [Populus alba x Populus x berolinensis]|nr:hypothetical protein NC651_005034 [Populus alba x Populus x berolinensis]
MYLILVFSLEPGLQLTPNKYTTSTEKIRRGGHDEARQPGPASSKEKQRKREADNSYFQIPPIDSIGQVLSIGGYTVLTLS